MGYACEGDGEDGDGRSSPDGDEVGREGVQGADDGERDENPLEKDQEEDGAGYDGEKALVQIAGQALREPGADMVEEQVRYPDQDSGEEQDADDGEPLSQGGPQVYGAYVEV